jgi:signal transduction histidine kinase
MAAILGMFLMASPLHDTTNYSAYAWEVENVAPLGLTPLLADTSWFGEGSSLAFLLAALGGLSCLAGVLICRRSAVVGTLLTVWPFVTILLVGTFVWGWWLALLMITCLVIQDSWRRAIVPLVATLLTAWLYALTGVPAALPIGAVNAGDYDGGRAVEAGIVYSLAVALVVGIAAVIRAANVVRRRGEAAARTERHALEVESVAAERARLARDLHDVVAHHVSLVAVRAESAPYAHPEMDETSRAAFAAIATDARSALGELRQVLTVLRRSDGDDRAPQPSACDIVGLVSAARDAGQDVTLTGRCEDVPDAQGYVLYRAAQEALTNARRHAPGAPATVTITDVSDVAGLRVTNPTDQRGPVEPGRGLIGMRERVEALGGAVTVNVEDSVFVLVVTLPVAPGARRAAGPAAVTA